MTVGILTIVAGMEVPALEGSVVLLLVPWLVPIGVGLKVVESLIDHRLRDGYIASEEPRR